MNWRNHISTALLLAVACLCLFEFVLHRQNVVHGFEVVFLSLPWMLLACLILWCSVFLWLTFSLRDFPLISLLIISIIAWFIGMAADRPTTGAFTLLFGVTLGKGARFLLKANGEWQMEDGKNNSGIVNRKSAIIDFLTGLILLLSFSSWWRLDTSLNFYPAGERWTGLWDNPNTYGMLMGAGAMLAVGLLTRRKNVECRMKNPAWASWNSALRIFLWMAISTLGVGLVMSYSRGAWLATAIGLLYLAWSYGKLKWQYVLPGVAIAALAALYFWGSTPDSAPWYVKRADLGRPSAQHRASAWLAGLEIMRDHPFGVGWNNAVKTYQEHYSPPEDGAAAITTNDYHFFDVCSG